jgi:leucyl aminopeptidase
MNLKIKNIEMKEVEGVIFPVYEDQDSKCAVTESFKAKGTFKAKQGEVFYYTTSENQCVILAGLGKMEDLKIEGMRTALAKATRKAKELKLASFGVVFFEALDACVGDRVKAITEAVALSLYDFTKYKTKKEEYAPEVFISGLPQEKVQRATEVVAETMNLVEGVCIARNLVNEPANVIYPETLATQVVELSKEAGFEVEIFDEIAIQEMKMEAFWEVAKGSDKLPRLIVMRYKGDPDCKETIGLIGKGLTYDTGGYSLKPSDSMKDMKSDMGGAASVIGAMYAIAKNKARCNVVAVVAAAENAISGGAYKPGDIIGSMGGKTIEVLNTDAEGRLTLIDAITYSIQKEKVDKIIDVATLTGAVLVALGETTTGVVTNDSAFYETLEDASKATGEKFWRLPNFEEYKELIKGDLADLKNVGGRNAGTITAGLFIGEFVEHKPWMHLDIAGTAWSSKNKDYLPKGGTGVPVRTLYQLLSGGCNCKH